MASEGRVLARLARSPVAVALAASLLVGLIALELSLPAVGASSERGSPADRRVAAAFAAAAVSFDYRSLDADVARVVAFGTPRFRSEFSRALGADFVQRAAALKTSSVGRVVAGPRLQRSGGGRASFVVLVDQSITPEGDQAPKVTRVGFVVTVQRRDHRVAAVRVV